MVANEAGAMKQDEENSGKNNLSKHQTSSSSPPPQDEDNACIGTRRRSQSVPSARPSLETVVVKSKRAASTLWTLLHAQSCSLSSDVCPHPGCKEAKLLHLHIKTCQVRQGESCPAQRRGCDQARQLLAHYRRCRAIRARQVGQPSSSRRDASRQHACLICSMVARQARSTLERTNVRSSTSSCRKPSRQTAASLMVTADTSVIRDRTLGTSPKSSSSLEENMDMPPPLPRSKPPGSVSSSADENGVKHMEECNDTSEPMSMAPPQPMRRRSNSLSSPMEYETEEKSDMGSPRRPRSVSCVDSTPSVAGRRSAHSPLSMLVAVAQQARTRSASVGAMSETTASTIYRLDAVDASFCQPIPEEEPLSSEKASAVMFS